MKQYDKSVYRFTLLFVDIKICISNNDIKNAEDEINEMGRTLHG